MVLSSNFSTISVILLLSEIVSGIVKGNEKGAVFNVSGSDLIILAFV